MKRILIICFAIVSLISCNSDSSTNSNSADKSVFHYNQPNPITSLDPAFAKSMNNIWAIDHLFNGLVQLDEDLNVRPAIAKKWEISEDGLEYRFELRDDVFFHDDDAFSNAKGRKVTAQDFVYSFNRLIDDQLASPGSWLFKGRVAADNPFSAPDEKTFVLRLQDAFRPMLGILTMQYCAVVPKEAVEKYGKAFRSHPVGTGPFQFKKWLESQALFLTKNDKYFEKEGSNQLPKVDAIKVSFIEDRKTAYLELINGNIDFFSGIESSFVNELLTAQGTLQEKQEERLQFLKSPFLNMEYLGINMELDAGNPLSNKKLRQALNYGIDRAQMLQTLRNNIGKPANSGFTPRGLPSFSDTAVPGYSYQPDKARKLLSDAGFPNGKGLPEISLSTQKDYLDLCTFITRQWEDLGVKVKIDILESATLRDLMRKSKVDFFRASWIADYPDAESFFTMFYSKYPAPPNYTQFNNAQFDQLYEAALKETDDNKRYDLYHQMDRILVEEAPVIFLFYDETALFAQKKIKGLQKNAVNLLSVKRIEK